MKWDDYGSLIKNGMAKKKKKMEWPTGHADVIVAFFSTQVVTFKWLNNKFI